MVTRRRKLQQPWSLLLQLLAVVLLLLAIADLRFGDFGGTQRRHVLILNTSAWMAAASEDGGATLMESARDRARAYLRAIPPDEAVMLIRADGNPAPATVFTTNRAELREAIEASEAGWTAADLASALELARNAVRISLGISDESEEGAPQAAFGEVAYVGSARVADPLEVNTTAQNFRFISVGEAIGDSGITRLAAQRIADDPERWEVVTEIRNDSLEERALRVEFSFADRAIGNRTIRLAPNSSGEISFRLRTRRTGLLAAKLEPGDSFAANDQTGIHLPAFTVSRVEVYSASPGGWRALLEANPRIEAEFRSGVGGASQARGGLSIFDRVAPAEAPTGNAIYFDPPRDGSPAEILRVVQDVKITQWNAAHPVARGLHSRDTVLRRASILSASPGDAVIAECEAGPVILARSEAGRKEVIFGFHPAGAELQNQLPAPLLFANAIAWMAPEVFRASEVAAQSPGLVELEVGDEPEGSISVTSSEDADVPWVLRDGRLRFYAGSPGTVTVRTPSLEKQLALNLPQLPTGVWTPPEGTLRGVPPPVSRVSSATAILWPWLALAALGCLVLEWKLYGRASRAGVEPQAPTAQAPARPGGGEGVVEGAPAAREKELAI